MKLMHTIFAKRYEILDNLGEGGMADVYLAFDTILKRDVAIKILRKNNVTSNSEKTFTVENLSETDKLYLRYRSSTSSSRRYSTAAITAQDAVAGYETTLQWSTTRPSY